MVFLRSFLRRHLVGKPVVVGASKSTLHPSLFRRHHCPVLENECENGERIGNDCEGNSTTFFLFLVLSLLSVFRDGCGGGYLHPSFYLQNSHARNFVSKPTLFPDSLSYPSISLSLSRSLGTGRREPWERGCVYTCPKDVKYTCPNVRPCMLSS